MILKKILGKKLENHILAVVITCVCYLIIGHEAYSEVFFWFSGAVSYCMPFTLLLIGISFILGKDNEKNAIFSLAFGIMAMGGTLAVAGIGCYALLVLCINEAFNHELSKKHLIVFFTWTIFALINVVAPGNYIRHTYLDVSGLHPMSALAYSVSMYGDRMAYFVKETGFLCTMAIVLICGILSGYEKTEFVKKHTLSACLLLIMPIVSIFPVALGYSVKPVSNRVLFIADMSIVGVTVYFVFICGLWIRYLCGDRTRYILVGTVMIGVLCFAFERESILNMNINLMSNMLAWGVYQDHFEVTKEFYKTLETYEKGSDVRIKKTDMPYLIKNSLNFYVFENPNDYMNLPVAEWYGFKSIALYDE